MPSPAFRVILDRIVSGVAALGVVAYVLSGPRAAVAARSCTAELREFVSSEAAYSGYAQLELAREVRVVMRSNFSVHDAEQSLP